MPAWGVAHRSVARSARASGRRRRASGCPEARATSSVVLAELVALEQWIARARRMFVFLGDHRIELARAKQGQRGFRLEVVELAGQTGMTLGQGGEGRDREHPRGGLEGRHAQPPARRVGALQRCLRSFDALEHLARMGGQDAPRVRKQHPAPGPLDQRAAGLSLEAPELLGDGRGRVVERVRHSGHAAAVLELDEQTQPSGVEHVAMLNKTNRKYDLF